MAKPLVMEYVADIDKAMKVLTTAIARLGYTLKGVDKENGLIAFETGMSMHSFAGQSMSVHILEIGDRVQITIGGTRKAHGASLQLYDWRESEAIAANIFDQIQPALGRGRSIRVHSTNRRRGSEVVLFLIFLGLVVVVLMLVVVWLLLFQLGRLQQGAASIPEHRTSASLRWTAPLELNRTA